MPSGSSFKLEYHGEHSCSPSIDYCRTPYSCGACWCCAVAVALKINPLKRRILWRCSTIPGRLRLIEGVRRSLLSMIHIMRRSLQHFGRSQSLGGYAELDRRVDQRIRSSGADSRMWRGGNIVGEHMRHTEEALPREPRVSSCNIQWFDHPKRLDARFFPRSVKATSPFQRFTGYATRESS